MKIWINPDSSSFGGTEPAATIQQTWTGTEQEGATGTNGFAAYKINASSLNAGFNLDELRVGTTWADVTPIPEPATIGMLGLGALVTIMARRMRQK